MTPFDPLKAQRNMIRELDRMHDFVSTGAREALLRANKAEAEYTELLILRNHLDDQLATARDRLRELEAEQAQGKMGSPP